jgi:hypothetical protein
VFIRGCAEGDISSLAVGRHFRATLRESGVEPRPDRVLAIPREMSVVSVDHRDRGAHQPRQLERGDAGGERLGRECMPQVVGAALRDPGGLKRRVPDPVAPVVEREVAALRGREQQGRVEPRRQLLQGVEGSGGERHSPT